MNQIDMLGRKALAFGCSVAYEEPMSRHTTFKIGGPADLFVTAHNVAMLSDFLREAKEMDVRVLMIGNGSNLLVSDEGVRGAVVYLDDAFCDIHQRGETELVCGAGVSLAGLCNFAKSRALSGLCLGHSRHGRGGGLYECRRLQLRYEQRRVVGQPCCAGWDVWHFIRGIAAVRLPAQRLHGKRLHDRFHDLGIAAWGCRSVRRCH